MLYAFEIYVVVFYNEQIEFSLWIGPKNCILQMQLCHGEIVVASVSGSITSPSPSTLLILSRIYLYLSNTKSDLEKRETTFYEFVFSIYQQ